MNKTKTLLFLVLASLCGTVSAQYSQLGRQSEFMLKAEGGYAPFVGNVGQPGDHGFYLDRFRSAATLNLMLGRNLSQDWFVGVGIGADYFHNFQQAQADPLIGATVFADVDFRPIWTALMGLDYQPSTILWAPMVGARAGGSLLLGDDEPAGYGTTITPMGEFYVGINWYYRHGLRNMEHNWHSFYLTLGIAYMQQALFLPVRVGWRW